MHIYFFKMVLANAVKKNENGMTFFLFTYILKIVLVAHDQLQVGPTDVLTS